MEKKKAKVLEVTSYPGSKSLGKETIALAKGFVVKRIGIDYTITIDNHTISLKEPEVRKLVSFFLRRLYPR